MSQLVHLRIRRSDGWKDFQVEVREGASVLEALEAAWRSDHSLLFRHSCHHGSCGTCGIRINEKEALACLTPVDHVARDGRPVRLEPLRNFPLVGDLMVDMQGLAVGIEAVGLPVVCSTVQQDGHASGGSAHDQYENCIECGLCISACPVAGSDPQFIGPAILAAGGRVVEDRRSLAAPAAIQMVGGEQGAWRCHGAFECSEVCPAEVDPAALILGLRRDLLQESVAGGRR